MIWQYDHATTNDYLCKNIIKPKCVDEWKTVYNERCKTTYIFDCSVPIHNQGYGQHALEELHQVYRYKAHKNGGPDSRDLYKKEPSNNMYEENIKNFTCNREPNVRCYKTPRQVKTKKCEEKTEQKCQKVRNTNPRPVQHQTCHDEPYEECTVEKQYQTRIAHVPTYMEECTDVPREICDNHGTTTLELKCVDETKPICEWKPKQPRCRKTPRQHCYKIPYQVKTTDCDESYKENIGLQNYAAYPNPE